MVDVKSVDEKIFDFWEKNKIYQKAKKQNSGKKKFYMMDGPPYATGNIHMGTALNKILKDIVIRSRRLQGFDVFDRPGYDTHGLPIEYQVEKEIGSKSKKDIEKLGVKKFIEKCRNFATKYIGVMNQEFYNLGVWMDWDNPYLSLDDKYIEAVWDVMKKADEKGLLYLGKYPVHLCPRCETAVAYNEIEYKKQDDTSIFVKFPLKENRSTFLIVWTTTPWTLPANTGVMAHPDFNYRELKVGNEIWLVAEELVDSFIERNGIKAKKLKLIKGRDIEGKEYENPLSKNLNLKIVNGYRIVLSGRYVNSEEGTGLVHCAPGHGKEDFEVGRENNLDAPCPVSLDGTFTKEAGKYAGKKIAEANLEIIKDLENFGFLIGKHKHSHDYPICWRCKNSLLLVSQPQWFLKITDIHKKILEENENTNWIPDWKQVRMKAWLEGISDWPISRERYWGTPLPIWICDKCNERKVIGSINELRKLSGKEKIGMHRPEIDSVSFKCSGKKCAGKMKRISAVLDVWFDSGVSSWAALEYPSRKDKFNKFWPADFNLEGNDQFRGWWNSQLILSIIGFDRRPFENIFVHGMVLDVAKKKMSKSLGNVISPRDVISRQGRDALRYYFAKVSNNENIAFDEKDFKEIQGVFRIMFNINSFVDQIEEEKNVLKIEDKWIISKYNSCLKKVTEALNSYRFHEAVMALEDFLIKDLSRTYIQIIRDRAGEVSEILKEIRIGLLKSFAPIAPFVSDFIWQDLRAKEYVKEMSIHLAGWSKFNSQKINTDLEERFSVALNLIEKGLAERDREKIGLKWPLSKASVYSNQKLDDELEQILLKQLNIKKIEWKESNGKEVKVELDTKITPELEAEGFARELTRRVQAERKNMGLKKENLIDLSINVDVGMAKRLESQIEFIKERTNSKRVEFVKDKTEFIEFNIKECKFGIKIRKMN